MSLPRYQAGCWTEEEPGSWSFGCVYLGNSLAAARKALGALRRRLPADASAWASYVWDQITGEVVA